MNRTHVEMETYQLDCLCPHCGVAEDCHTEAKREKNGEPEEGSISLCVYCAGLSVFTLKENGKLRLRKATDEDIAQWPPETQSEVNRALFVLQTRRRLTYDGRKN